MNEEEDYGFLITECLVTGDRRWDEVFLGSWATLPLPKRREERERETMFHCHLCVVSVGYRLSKYAVYVQGLMNKTLYRHEKDIVTDLL